MNTRLFGTSGVRGVAGREITPELCLNLGFTLATYLGNSGTVVVGRDPRTTGRLLESVTVAGLLAGGCDVALAGMVPTPVLALGTKLIGAKAGVMVTASHNPPEYNGLKFWDEKGMAYTEEKESEIERIFFAGGWRKVEWNRIGSAREVDLLSLYEEEIRNRLHFESSLKVVVDCGNGAGSVLTPLLLRVFGCKVVSLNSNPDGRFPARGLEPNEKNLQSLAQVVREVAQIWGWPTTAMRTELPLWMKRGGFWATSCWR